MFEKASSRFFALLFGSKELNQQEPLIDENPTEDAKFFDLHPITIECSLNEQGDEIISNVIYDDEVLIKLRSYQIDIIALKQGYKHRNYMLNFKFQ